MRTIDLFIISDALKLFGSNKGVLEDSEIEVIMNQIMERGGRVKNLYDTSGKKISYYQVNGTFFSELGEDEKNYY